MLFNSCKNNPITKSQRDRMEGITHHLRQIFEERSNERLFTFHIKEATT